MSLKASIANLKQAVSDLIDRISGYIDTINNQNTTISNQNTTISNLNTTISNKDKAISLAHKYVHPFDYKYTYNGGNDATYYITDKLGTCMVFDIDAQKKYNHDNADHVIAYYRVKNELGPNGVFDVDLSIPWSVTNHQSIAIDLSQSEGVRITDSHGRPDYYYGTKPDGSNGAVFYPLYPRNVRRLLLSKQYNSFSYSIYSPDQLIGGLYLQQTYKELTGQSPNWVIWPATKSIPIKNPPDSDVPYYLNKFIISASDIENILLNMVDRSSETTVKYITLGSENLAKLTEAQKEIAYAKGWDLQ